MTTAADTLEGQSRCL